MSKLVPKNIVLRFKVGSTIKIGNDIYKELSDGTFRKSGLSYNYSFKEILQKLKKYDSNLKLNKNPDGTYTTYYQFKSGLRYSPDEKKLYKVRPKSSSKEETAKTSEKGKADDKKGISINNRINNRVNNRTNNYVPSETQLIPTMRTTKGYDIGILNDWSVKNDGNRWNRFIQGEGSDGTMPNLYTKLKEYNGGKDFESVLAFQNYINGVLNRYGSEYGQIAEDNKFGNLTEEGARLALELLSKGLKNDYTGDTTPILKPLLQTNFGYTTTNTYEDPSKSFRQRLQSLGINSNQSLINWLNNTKDKDISDTWQKQFRSDVERSLGGNYSDENIRKIFNTQGNWYRGGDYNDFLNALATQAGTWNGIADKTKQLYYTNLGNSVINNMIPPSGNYVSPLEIRNFVKNNSFSGKFVPTIRLKLGAKLVSKNIIERFKRRSINSFRMEGAVTSLKTVEIFKEGGTNKGPLKPEFLVRKLGYTNHTPINILEEIKYFNSGVPLASKSVGYHATGDNKNGYVLDEVVVTGSRRNGRIRKNRREHPKLTSLQQYLKNLGYYTGEVDGYDGPLTQKAIKEATLHGYRIENYKIISSPQNIIIDKNNNNKISSFRSFYEELKNLFKRSPYSPSTFRNMLGVMDHKVLTGVTEPYLYINPNEGMLYRLLGNKVLYKTPVATGVYQGTDGASLLEKDANGNPVYDRTRSTSSTPAGVFTLVNPYKNSGKYNNENVYHLREASRGNKNAQIINTALHAAATLDREKQLKGGNRRLTYGCVLLPNGEISCMERKDFINSGDSVYIEPTVKGNYLYEDKDGHIKTHFNSTPSNVSGTVWGQKFNKNNVRYNIGY